MTAHRFKVKEGPTDYGWYFRGNLPHVDAKLVPQFVTFRLADSMPQSVLDKWRDEVQSDPHFRRKIERYLDAGHGQCFLRLPSIAKMVADVLKFHAGKKYELSAWVIMPNHVHVLFAPMEGQHLPDIMHSIKSYTAQQANKLLDRKGQFWQHESFARYIRSDRHFRAVVRYIEMNLVKARLCDHPGDWEYSSAWKP